MYKRCFAELFGGYFQLELNKDVFVSLGSSVQCFRAKNLNPLRISNQVISIGKSCDADHQRRDIPPPQNPHIERQDDIFVARNLRTDRERLYD